MVRLDARQSRGEHWSREAAVTLPAVEEVMAEQLGRFRDPFEGKGARRRDVRLRVEGILALGLSITACGLTAAVWVRTLAPVIALYGLG